MESRSEVVERDGSKMVAVHIGSTLPRDIEDWFTKCLMQMRGIAYIEYHVDTRRLAGYGVWEYAWENFRFWIGVSLMSDGSDD